MQAPPQGLWPVFLEFFKLGLISFGGPAAHAALMEKEIVNRKKWISHQQFLDFMGGVNLIPGPNSTQMTMLVGYHLRGWAGMIAAGMGFIIPAALITLVIAVFYVRYGSLPGVEPVMQGIKPAILMIIAAAILSLARKAIKSTSLALLGIAVVALALLGVSELSLILAAGLLGMLGFMVKAGWRHDGGSLKNLAPFLLLQGIALSTPFTSLKLFWIFIKIGALLFGSGYVLIAYMDGELVQNLGWISREQLLDAIAIGQFTPGPLLSAATFVGYTIDGYSGALLATLGIFLPSFLFIMILYPFLPRLRKSAYTSRFLDSVNVAAVAVMLAVSLTMAGEILVQWQGILIALLAAAAIWGPYKLNSIWIVLLSGIIGLILYGPLWPMA